MNNHSQDAGIPVLTEIIPPRTRVEEQDAIPELPISTALPPITQNPPPIWQPTSSPAALPPSAASAKMDIPPTRTPEVNVPIEGWLEGEWTRLEQKVSERTLSTLLDRIDPLLEEHIRESISASLDEAMDTIRANLQLSIEQLVREAVAEEIRSFDFSKNKNS